MLDLTFSIKDILYWLKDSVGWLWQIFLKQLQLQKSNIASCNGENKAKNKVNTNKQSKQNTYKERILNKNLCKILNNLLFYMLYGHHDLVIL